MNWQERRSRFNHDWLSNRFINNLSGFIAMAQQNRPDKKFLAKFIENDMAEWPQKIREAEKIVESLQMMLSPVKFFENEPLKSAGAKWPWLKAFVVGMWRIRENIDELKADLKKKIMTANAQYQLIMKRQTNNQAINSINKKAVDEFIKLRDLCVQMASAFSQLPRKTRII
jgi:hypothetical protein